MKKIAVYPGTFDPITNGHVDIISRATRLFDRLIVAIAASPNKKPVFSLEERVDIATQVLRDYENVSIIGFESLLTEFVQQQGAQVILRGLRAVSDFDYEFQLAGIYQQLAPKIESVFLMPSQEFTYISASYVREIASLGGDVSSFVPELVAKELKKKLAIKRSNSK
jgi:pantetheine-phosphate adenylyltransferase